MACCCSAGKVQRCYTDGSALRVLTFETVEITANPNGNGIFGIPNVNNADYSGLAPMNIGNMPAPPTASGVEMDLGFVNPRDGIMQVRIANNYGNILNDNDGILNPTVQLFDPAGAPLTAPFVATAGNGGGFFVTAVPGAPINNVGFMHVSDLKNIVINPTVGIREIELMQLGIGPAALLYCPDNVCPEASPLADATPWIVALDGLSATKTLPNGVVISATVFGSSAGGSLNSNLSNGDFSVNALGVAIGAGGGSFIDIEFNTTVRQPITTLQLIDLDDDGGERVTFYDEYANRDADINTPILEGVGPGGAIWEPASNSWRTPGSNNVSSELTFNTPWGGSAGPVRVRYWKALGTGGARQSMWDFSGPIHAVECNYSGLSWVDPRTGVTIDPATLVDCR